jgi:hypothetical protein
LEVSGPHNLMVFTIDCGSVWNHLQQYEYLVVFRLMKEHTQASSLCTLSIHESVTTSMRDYHYLQQYEYLVVFRLMKEHTQASSLHMQLMIRTNSLLLCYIRHRCDTSLRMTISPLVHCSTTPVHFVHSRISDDNSCTAHIYYSISQLAYCNAALFVSPSYLALTGRTRQESSLPTNTH